MPKMSLLCLAIVAWLLFIFLGMRVLWDYDYSAGNTATAPSELPPIHGISGNTGRATLLMFVHPHCPCSRASVVELAVIMTRSQHRVNGYVMFLQPAHYSHEWVQTELWDSSAVIPEVKPLVDNEGRYAKMFGAKTSGQTILYNAAGHLLFEGGITESRGHMGDNLGQMQIISLLNRESITSRETPVYGCPLFSDPRNCEQGKFIGCKS